MADRLIHQFFTDSSLNAFADSIQNSWKSFDKSSFLNLVFDENWHTLALKQRMRHVTLCLKNYLPDQYPEAVRILIDIASEVKGFEGMVLPDYVELFGLDDWETSLPALAVFTQYSSSEFAIRPFIIQNPEKAMQFILECAGSPIEGIRRFASEGCRPRLPWAMALPVFKKNPDPIFPVLELLKSDNSEFVRRSVANNLNDISKDHPDKMLQLCSSWAGQSSETDWIIKHACRSLLKAGSTSALQLFGFSNPEEIRIQNLSIKNPAVKIGTDLHFSFTLMHAKPDMQKIRLEYAIDYMKANGKQARKVFTLSEKEFPAGEYKINSKQSFAEMTTRKHYPGKHQLAVLVNGEEKCLKTFAVKA